MFRMTELDRYTTLAYYALLEAEELRAELLTRCPVTCCTMRTVDLADELKPSSDPKDWP
jgi:hypothetical protein